MARLVLPDLKVGDGWPTLADVVTAIKGIDAEMGHKLPGPLILVQAKSRADVDGVVSRWLIVGGGTRRACFLKHLEFFAEALVAHLWLDHVLVEGCAIDSFLISPAISAYDAQLA